jgi:hypothetical protein
LASLPWCPAPIWGPISYFCYCQTVAGLLMWGALSDERTGLSFTTAAGPHQRSHSQVLNPRDSGPYFTVSYSRLPQPGRARSSVFISPRNRVTQLYSQALGSFFVTFYDSQDYGGGIRTRLHTGTEHIGTDRVENAVPLLRSRLLGCPRDRYSVIV